MIRAQRRLSALVLAVLLTASVARADWPTYQADVQHTGRTAADVNPFNLRKAWSAPQGYGIPLIVGNTIYSMRNQQGIGGDVTTVRSFDLATGAVNWTYTNTFSFPAQPTYQGGSVVFAAESNSSGAIPNLYSLNAATGAVQYTVQLSSTVDTGAMPTVYVDPGTGARTAYVVAPSSGGGTSLVAVNLGASSGSVLWSQNNHAFGSGSVPTILGNSVLLAGPGQFYAFDRTTGAMNRFHTSGLSGGGNATVVADAANNRFYVLEAYTSSAFTALTAYQYTNNSTITQLWQRTDTATIRSGGTPAIGPDGKVYVASNTALSELDPTTGVTLRSITSRSYPNGTAPVISNGKLWIYETISFNTSVSAYDLATFTFDRSFAGGRGSLNSSYDGPGALTDGYFLLDYGNIYGQPGFDVYVIPEPSGLLLAAAVVGGVGFVVRRRRGDHPPGPLSTGG